MDFLERRDELLGTVVRVKLYGGSESLLDRAFIECRRIEECYSRFIGGNILADLNSHIGEWCEVGKELFDLINFGEELRKLSNGAFDLSVASTLNEWGYKGFVYLGEKLNVTGMGKGLELDSQGLCVKLTSPIDLGAIGKGYAVDQMVKILKESSGDFLVDAGGDIFAEGSDLASGQNSWKIAFENPLDSSQALGVVDVSGFALASSARNRRKWGDKHHLVDARKQEVANECLAVYVQSDSAMEADAYSTLLFVIGFDEAIEVLKKIPVEAMLIASTGTIWKSDGFIGELFIV